MTTSATFGIVRDVRTTITTKPGAWTVLSEHGDTPADRVFPLGFGFGYGWMPQYRADAEELDQIVELDVDVDGGRLVISAFRIERRPGGAPISMDVLKSMPLVGLLLLGIVDSDTTGLLRSDGKGGWSPADWGDLDELPELERVAIIYRAEYFVGCSPTKEVAAFLGVSRDVAAKKVQAARRAGLLGATDKGKKGA